MSDNLFRDLEIRPPDLNLEVGSGSVAHQTGAIMCGIETAFLERRPDLLLVVGDVTSTMAATLVAAKMHIRTAHVEAGLRSFDRHMPEEINRIVTDALADYLFTTEPGAEKNLLAEGVAPERIFFVGNVMIDTLRRFRDRAASSTILSRFNLTPKHYAVATLHRPSNVDDPARLRSLIEMLRTLAETLPVVFPVHPRTRQMIANAGISTDGLLVADPLGYLDFLWLNSQSRMVLTDSGGLQEETTILQVPCLTIRENTERPVTVEQGTNRLVGVNPAEVLKAARELLDGPPPTARVPDLWDGLASVRIVDTLEKLLAS